MSTKRGLSPGVLLKMYATILKVGSQVLVGAMALFFWGKPYAG